MRFWIILIVASAVVQARGDTRHPRSRGDTKLYNYSPTPPVESPAPKARKSKPAPVNPCVVVDPGFIVCGGAVMGRTETVSVARDSRGRIERSPAARKSFQSQAPCPANGKTHGRCPGYVIDHIVPLACGGLDDPVNLQWQTVADGKAKDKWERKRCGK